MAITRNWLEILQRGQGFGHYNNFYMKKPSGYQFLAYGRLIAFASLWSMALAGEPPLTIADIEREKARITPLLNTDPVAYSKAAAALSEKIARAAGFAAEYAEQRRLEQKYGPFDYATISPPAPGEMPKIIDHNAWRGLFERDGNVIQATLFMDRGRYANVKPSNVVIQFRSIGVNTAEEGTLFHGGNSPLTFRLTLAYELKDNDTYVARFVIPFDQIGRYVVQISADVEGLLSTNTAIPLVLNR